MNTAPDSVDTGWSDQVAAFFTFGPGYTAGVYVLTVLGFILMVAALVGWIVTEDRKLTRQANLLRSAGLRTESMPGAQVEGD
jgi:hypothetical protein